MEDPTFSAEFRQKYEVLGKVGEGGMGAVYKANHRSLMRATAIKVVHASSFDDEKAIANFLGEAQLCAHLSHPNIVKVYEASVEGGNPYIAFEYIEGITLAEKIKTTPAFPIKDALAIAEQVLEGLSVAHEQGIIHRDIKPENILIDGEGNAKIADFGIAKRSTAKARKSKDWVLVGTPAYMSPEQAWGDEATERSDLYSVGAVLFEMLGGQPPFTGNTMQLVSQKMNTNARPVKQLRPEVPQQLDDIVAGALARKAEERYENAADFANKLRKARSFLDKWMAEERGDRPRSRVSSSARSNSTSGVGVNTSSIRVPPPPQRVESAPVAPRGDSEPGLAEIVARIIAPALQKQWWHVNGVLVACIVLAIGMLSALVVFVVRNLVRG